MSLLSRFFKPKYKPGWLGVSCFPGGVSLAIVERSIGGRPQVLASQLLGGSLFSRMTMENAIQDSAMDGHCASVLLEPGEYQMLIVDSPNVGSKEEKAGAVRWNLKDMIDFPVDDAAIDVIDIPTEQHMPRRQNSVYAVAARNDTIQRYATLQENDGMTLTAIDIPELAQRNLSALAEEPAAGLAMLSHDHNGCLITFTFNGELYLYRRIETPFDAMASMDEEQLQQLYHRIALDLQRSLDYVERHLHFITINRLLIAPMAGPSGLADYLAGNLQLKVEPFKLGKVMDLSRVPLLDNPVTQAKCLLAIGAALRQEGLTL